MSDNLFFDPAQLKYLGKNVIIGKTVRIRFPELVEIHDNAIIDDFTYISTGLVLGKHSTIEAGSVIMGGPTNQVTVGNFSCVSSGTTIMCGTHDFKTGLHINHNKDIPQGIDRGDVAIGDHVILGSKCTVLPNTDIATGTRAGAHSLLKGNIPAWTIVGGTPAKTIGQVDQEQVLKYLKDFLTKFDNDLNNLYNINKTSTS